MDGGEGGVGRGSNAGKGEQDVFQELREVVSTAGGWGGGSGGSW